jgi:hypothetical protein
MGPHVLRLTGGRTGHRREMEEGLLIIVCYAPARDALSPAPTSLNVLSLSLFFHLQNHTNNSTLAPFLFVQQTDDG